MFTLQPRNSVSLCRSGIAPALVFLVGAVIAVPAAFAQGEQGNVCVRDYRGGAVCTANDVRIEALNVVAVNETCIAGTPGETEVVFEALISADGSPDRYDIGVYLALDGDSARDGDSCYHDFLSGPLSATPTYGDVNMDTVADIVGGPWWDGGGDADACGDIESNTQVFTTMPSLRFACIDSNGDGSADVSVCTSWDNNIGSACNTVVDAFPGTNSKCSCGAVELGIPPAPEITVVKTPATQNVVVGGTANFTFTVTSRTTVNNVVVSDNPTCDTLSGPAGDTGSDGILVPGETWVYTCAIDNVMADFMDTVTAAGDGPLGPVEDTDTASVTVISPAMTLTKSGTLNDGGDGVANAGDTISYSFLVTNTGNVTLNNVTVTDPLAGLSAITCPSGNPIPTLVPAAMETCTASLTLTQAHIDAGQVDNTATVDSDETTPVQDLETVTLTAAPALTLVKTGTFNDDVTANGSSEVGETIGYTFDVTNTGNVTLAGIAVTDPLIATITCPGGNPIPSLAPGASVQCTGSYALVQGDIDAGVVNNTATATGDDPGGNPVSDMDTESTTLPGGPVIGVAKSVGSVTDQGGGVFDIALDFVIENLGAVSLSNVRLTDDLGASFPAPVTFAIQAGPTAGGTLTANAGFDGSGDQNLLVAGSSSLAVGTTGAVSVTVRITLNGATGPFTNTAIASGDGPSGGMTTDVSDDGTDPDPNGNGDPGDPDEDDPTVISVTTEPSVSTTKASDFNVATQDNDGSGDLTPGDGLTYTIAITNDGTADALNVVLDDTPDANTTLLAGSVTTSRGTVVLGNTGGDTSVQVQVGTLAAGGGSVTIQFEVTINDPLPEGVSEILNQGIVSGGNFDTIVTDDPKTTPGDDPTVDVVGTPTAPPADIPTLSEWMLMLLALLLGTAAAVRLRRGPRSALAV